MSHFLRLLSEANKSEALADICARIRNGEIDSRSFDALPESFDAIPGKPFAYWVSTRVREIFQSFPVFGMEGRYAWVGLQTNDDFQWVRLWWEEGQTPTELTALVPFFKGGHYSPFYADVYLCVRWGVNGRLIKEWKNSQLQAGKITANNSKCWNEKDYLRKGIAWPRRTQAFAPRIFPGNCIFADKGPAAFVTDDLSDHLLALLAIMNSMAFLALVETRLNAADATARSYEVGVIESTPMPPLSKSDVQNLATLARRSWSLKRTLDTSTENSHAFLLPAALRSRLGNYDPTAIESELLKVQGKIDTLAFDLYDFAETDRQSVMGISGDAGSGDVDDDDDEDSETDAPSTDALLSWGVGVAFGRFDWRLATGERAAPAEPEPFDPLPAKSPGMLPDGAEPFRAHAGILVDDQGHPQDLARLVEEVLNRVDVSVPDDVRRWLRKDFFAFHLQRYSKSRRKAPIYWPLSTASGSYTLWVYYPSLNNQTLFTAVNDFLDGPNGKLTQVSRECAELRIKGSGRSRDDEKQYETLQTFEQELADLRDALLKIAPTYQPNHDDGVQITAAPLWPLFRHKPWQKVLKDTWTKLEKGDYDWAHLAMAYWPERVREKCKTDKSLAIAHGLEDLYIEPEAIPKKTRSAKGVSK